MTNLELHLEGINRYRITSEKIRKYRDRITVVELGRKGVATGRVWEQPYDTVKCNISELQNRFNLLIKETNKVKYVSDSMAIVKKNEGFADGLAKEATEHLIYGLHPVFRGRINEAINATNRELEREKNHLQIIPEQVISEEEIERALQQAEILIKPILVRIISVALNHNSVLSKIIPKGSFFRRLINFILRR